MDLHVKPLPAPVAFFIRPFVRPFLNHIWAQCYSDLMAVPDFRIPSVACSLALYVRDSHMVDAFENPYKDM